MNTNNKQYTSAQVNPHMKGVRLPVQNRANWLKEAVDNAANNAHQPNKLTN
jgi:hypothetical protein